MKKTYLMLLLALGGFGSSCTNDDGTTDSPSGSAGEIQLVFAGAVRARNIRRPSLPTVRMR